MIPMVGLLTKPKSYARFFAMARACLNHDASAVLPQIAASTLVIGGGRDRSLGGEASRQLAETIPGAQLRMYPNAGHGLYEEEKDFQAVVLHFLRGQREEQI